MVALAAINLIAISLVIYFAPAVIAWHRRHPYQASILVVNLFLGWTLLGWVGSLAWAFAPIPAKAKPPAPAVRWDVIEALNPAR